MQQYLALVGPCRRRFNEKLATRLELPLIPHSDDYLQRTDHDNAFAQPQTPPNRARIGRD